MLPGSNSNHNRNNWCLISTYKDNFDLMETYVNYYHLRWGIKKFYFIIGITEKTNFQKILQRIERLNKNSSFHIDCISFKTEIIVSENYWGKQKEKYFNMLNRIPAKYDHVLNIDNDEFLYVDNIDIIDTEKYLHFHFLEFVPHDTFNIQDDFNWSLQGWFYRVNSFRNKKAEDFQQQIRLDELDRLQKDVCLLENESALNKITHQWCKLIRFDRDSILDPWSHEDGSPICDKIKTTQNMDEIINLLKKTYFCYHLAILDEDYFINKKIKWLNPITSSVKHQAGDINADIHKYFKKYYTNTSTYKFTDNYLKDFWVK